MSQLITHRFKRGSFSISDKTSYGKISWSLEAVGFVFKIVRSLWNFTGTSAASAVPVKFRLPISRLRDFARSYDKTFCRILKQGPGLIRHLNIRELRMTTSDNCMTTSYLSQPVNLRTFKMYMLLCVCCLVALYNLFSVCYGFETSRDNEWTKTCYISMSCDDTRDDVGLCDMW